MLTRLWTSVRLHATAIVVAVIAALLAAVSILLLLARQKRIVDAMASKLDEANLKAKKAYDEVRVAKIDAKLEETAKQAAEIEDAIKNLPEPRPVSDTKEMSSEEVAEALRKQGL